MQTSRSTARLLHRLMLAGLLLCMLISMIGCSTRYVAIDAGGTEVTIKKSELDRIYQDNELLLKALEQCQGK